jgi:hypothetical protein
MPRSPWIPGKSRSLCTNFELNADKIAPSVAIEANRGQCQRQGI